ncbi:MAG: methionyl-tRNA formyltransferase [Helicobacteraceae bacterium 4484_230]|nr:MAG: methionyl-tRNA formyltransferase [Helicobacteraceae bacterium 4484_230]
MKIIFMGTPDYASRILESLVAQKDMDVVAVYTQPDKPVGRKKTMTPPPVKVLAEEQNIPVYQPGRLRDDAVVEQLLQIECDFIVVAAYGQILPKEILGHAPCINLHHASILPQYRGASPIQQTLLNGDRETGVTAMLMEEGLDTGPILTIERITVADDEMLESLFGSSLKPLPQNDSEATYCKKITKSDGLVRFDDAASLFDRYRAFTPWPGIYLESGLKLKKIELVDSLRKHKAGRILTVDKESVTVGCRSGELRIYTLQPSSKKEMKAVDYLNGKRLGVDDILA